MPDPSLGPTLSTIFTGTSGASAIRAWYTYWDFSTGHESGRSPIYELDAVGLALITLVAWHPPVGVTQLPDPASGYPLWKLYCQAKINGQWYEPLWQSNGTVFFDGSGHPYETFDVLSQLQTTPMGWLRLRHSSGQSWVQQDGAAVQVRAAGVDVLHLPLPSLGAAPDTLVGQDPATGLPAFCPTLVPTTTTVILGGGGGSLAAPPSTCVQVRCGVSAVLRDHLLSLYDDWRAWLDPLFQACATLGVAVAVATVPWDWIADLGLASAGDAIKGSIISLLQGFGGAITGNLLPPLDPDLKTHIQQAAFDALTCTGDQVQVSAAEVAAWQAALAALTTWPLASLAAPFCGVLLQYTPLAAWQAAAASASPSHVCDAWP